MFNISESFYLSNQLNQFLVGKKVKELQERNIKYHFFNLDNYNKLLKNKNLQNALSYGSYIDLNFQDVTLSLDYQTKIRYYNKVPNGIDALVIIFYDNSCLTISNLSKEGFHLHCGIWDNPEYIKSQQTIFPLDERFNKDFFLHLLQDSNQKMTIMEFFIENKRMFGLNEDIFLDIFYHAGLNPKQQLSILSTFDLGSLFLALKSTLQEITSLGGRRIYQDLFGRPGQYKLIFNKQSNKCYKCENEIIKEKHCNMIIYYCPHCQELHEEEEFNI